MYALFVIAISLPGGVVITIIACYLGNTSAKARYEQSSHVLLRLQVILINHSRKGG